MLFRTAALQDLCGRTGSAKVLSAEYDGQVKGTPLEALHARNTRDVACKRCFQWSQGLEKSLIRVTKALVDLLFVIVKRSAHLTPPFCAFFCQVRHKENTCGVFIR